MSDRIRQLEDGLAILQSSVDPNKPHPLLDRSLLQIKSGLQLHSALHGLSPGVDGGGVGGAGGGGGTKTEQDDDAAAAQELEKSESIDAFGTLAVRDDGVATFYGRSAGSEVRYPSVCHDLRDWRESELFSVC